MKKIILFIALTTLASCGVNKTETPVYHHPDLSGEVPATATGMPGYEYPAMTLDEYNKLQAESGSHNE